MQDRYAFQQQLPPIDAEQNWFLTNSEVENGYTQLEFYRQFVTCDELDREIHVSHSDRQSVGFIIDITNSVFH